MNVILLGSLNLDYVYSVDHFVESGETIASMEMNHFCGGKGLNQSVALSKAGAKVYHAGRVGKGGEILLDRLKENGINVDHVVIDPCVNTGHAIIQLEKNSGQNCIIIYAGANGKISKEYIDTAYSKFSKNDITLLQNEISNLEYAIICAHKKGLKIALNPSPMNDTLKKSSALQYVDWFILNKIEGSELTGKTEPTEICYAMREKYPQGRVLLTLGEEGAMYYDGVSFEQQGSYKVNVVDTTGAGDTFAGYFVACMAENLDVKTAMTLASKAAAIAVSRPGASDSIPARSEVEAADICY